MVTRSETTHAMSQEQMKSIQDSLALLLSQNKLMSEKIDTLERENKEMRNSAMDAQARVEGNKTKWVEINAEASELFQKMAEIRADLKRDKVDDKFIEENSAPIDSIKNLPELWRSADGSQKIPVKREPSDLPTPGTPFDSIGKEERIDVVFGRDGDYTALSMRRFIERCKVVKEFNMRAQLRGWDSPSYRAGKLKLCLMGDAFDYVSFASSIYEKWAEDDEAMIERLKEKFTNIHAIELNILEFERSSQEPRESISDYMSRLRRSVKDAYDGDLQRELDRKVAWKFVSGLSDERVRRKLLEDGWMKTRQETKPLEDLL